MKRYIYFLIIFILILAFVLVYKNNGLNFILAQLNNPSFIIKPYTDATSPVVENVNIDYGACDDNMAILTAKVIDNPPPSNPSGVNPNSVKAIIGGSSPLSMKDDGNYPDETAGDDIYSVLVPKADYTSGSDIYIYAQDNAQKEINYPDGQFTPPDCGDPVVSGVTKEYTCSTSVNTLKVTATIKDDSGIDSARVVIQDAYPTGNIKGGGTMIRQGTSDTYIVTINVGNVENYPVGTYYFYITAKDKSNPSREKSYSDLSWKFEQINCGYVPPPGEDNDLPTVTNPTVVFNCDTNKVTTTATITDISGILEAFVIFKNSAGTIVKTEEMTNQGSNYTYIADISNYQSGVYNVYISATDNSASRNNGITDAGFFSTRYAIDWFTVNPTSAVAGANMGTPLTLSAHMSCASALTQEETITFSDETEDPDVVIGSALVQSNGTASITNYRIATFIKGSHTLRATHEDNPQKDIPYSTLTAQLNVTDVPVCSTAQSGDTICVYITIIKNFVQLDDFTITATDYNGITTTYTQAQYEADEDLILYRKGVVRPGATTGTKNHVVLSVNLTGATLCSGVFPLAECIGSYPVSGETVTFTDQTDNVVLGTADTNPSGVATLSFYPPIGSSNNFGKHTIRATYGGSIERRYKPSYKENFLNEAVYKCNYANMPIGSTTCADGTTNCDKICVYLGFLNSTVMSSFTISPTNVTAGKNTGAVSPGTLVTFTATLPGLPVGEKVIFIDETQEFVIGKYLIGGGGGGGGGGGTTDALQNVVLDEASTDNNGVAILQYRFPYAVRDPGQNFYTVDSGYQYDQRNAGKALWQTRLMAQTQGTHKIMAVYEGSIANNLQPSWIKNNLNLSVPGTCIWFPNQLNNWQMDRFEPESGWGDIICPAISNKLRTAAPPPPPYISP